MAELLLDFVGSRLFWAMVLITVALAGWFGLPLLAGELVGERDLLVVVLVAGFRWILTPGCILGALLLIALQLTD